MNEEVEKRPRGRPRKNPLVEREPIHEPKSSRMQASPNWETIDPFSEASADRFKIDPAILPDDLAFMWVTDTVYGQPDPQHRMTFEKGGWTPVHQSDFDGQLDGMFMKKGDRGEINNGGLVLMARPVELQIRAKHRERKAANEPIQIKEQALRGGDLPGVSLDPDHPSARRYNHITKTMERIEIPED